MSKKLIRGIVLIICGILFYPIVERILSPYAYEEWPMSVQTPLSIAFFVSVLALFIFGIISIVQAIRSRNDEPASGNSSNPKSLGRIACIILGSITFILGIFSAGSLLAIVILWSLSVVFFALGIVFFVKNRKEAKHETASSYAQSSTPKFTPTQSARVQKRAPKPSHAGSKRGLVCILLGVITFAVALFTGDLLAVVLLLLSLVLIVVGIILSIKDRKATKREFAAGFTPSTPQSTTPGRSNNTASPRKRRQPSGQRTASSQSNVQVKEVDIGSWLDRLLVRATHTAFGWQYVGKASAPTATTDGHGRIIQGMAKYYLFATTHDMPTPFMSRVLFALAEACRFVRRFAFAGFVLFCLLSFLTMIFADGILLTTGTLIALLIYIASIVLNIIANAIGRAITPSAFLGTQAKAELRQKLREMENKRWLQYDEEYEAAMEQAQEENDKEHDRHIRGAGSAMRKGDISGAIQHIDKAQKHQNRNDQYRRK